jgi:hypothetical protein
LRIFAAAAALLVGQRSIKDILPARALLLRQISSNAPVPYLRDGFLSLIDPHERNVAVPAAMRL